MSAEHVMSPLSGTDDGRSRLVLSTSSSGARVTVTAGGQLDIATTPLLREELVEVFLRGAPEHLVVDLTDVEYADGAGLGILVGARRRVAADNGQMTVVAHDRVRRVMELSGLHELWSIVASITDVRD